MKAEHYVFNVVYAPAVASTVILVQKLLLGLKVGQKMMNKVLKLITKLKAI